MEHYTAEQLLAQERQARETDAARIDRLENLAHFLRHELRNSVTGVRTSLDLPERRTPPDDRNRVYFERAGQSLKVIQRLLESASQASSLESSFIRDPFAPLDVVPLVADEVDSQRLMHLDLDFDLRRQRSPLRVEGNPERIVQLLQNLLTNAVDHHESGTPIRATVGRVGPWARLTVENEGPTLPPEGDAIFDLFASFRARTDPASKRGFGLYLVRLIAERCGGSVRAGDLLGGDGVCFKVLLPLSCTAALAAIQVAPVAVAAGHHLASATGAIEQTGTAAHRRLLPMSAGLEPAGERYSPTSRASHGLGVRHRGDCRGRARCRACLNGPDEIADSRRAVTSRLGRTATRAAALVSPPQPKPHPSRRVAAPLAG